MVLRVTEVLSLGKEHRVQFGACFYWENVLHVQYPCEKGGSPQRLCGPAKPPTKPCTRRPTKPSAQFAATPMAKLAKVAAKSAANSTAGEPIPVAFPVEWHVVEWNVCLSGLGQAIQMIGLWSPQNGTQTSTTWTKHLCNGRSSLGPPLLHSGIVATPMPSCCRTQHCAAHGA